jgi:hypothetical protein
MVVLLAGVGAAPGCGRGGPSSPPRVVGVGSKGGTCAFGAAVGPG